MSWRAELARFTAPVVVLTPVSTATIVALPLTSAASDVIVQASPFSGSTPVSGNATFTVFLEAPSGFVAPVRTDYLERRISA
jgi:hypothetical protein